MVSVYNSTAQKLASILHMNNPGQQKALLAELRRGVGRAPGELPSLWGILLEELPEEMMGNGTSPSRAEWAIYLSLTLFGVHQQGHDPKQQPMHQKDQSFGSSVAHLVTSEDDKDRMIRRFNIAATATDIKELSHHLRGIIQLLRAEGIALDYAQLSNDLYLFQDIHHRSNVCLRWGQDFYRVLNHIIEQEEEHTDE